MATPNYCGAVATSYELASFEKDSDRVGLDCATTGLLTQPIPRRVSHPLMPFDRLVRLLTWASYAAVPQEGGSADSLYGGTAAHAGKPGARSVLT
eukprot:7754854-Pyramimonas_sp.AAC.1